MTLKDVKPGTEILFTPTGKTFKIANITDKRISWYTGFLHKGGNGKNVLKMSWISLKAFQRGVDKGSYVLA